MFNEEQIIGFLQEAEGGLPVKELCRKHGFSEGSFYAWRNKFAGLTVSKEKWLKELENRPHDCLQKRQSCLPTEPYPTGINNTFF